ncbi:DUF4190 domain-containing protein [Nonomuraea wenchangensis]|uniref:DUF4190 domain-containing protein n=1 Tax=Nonomuraea wenchangensis TaxID=568860 RepID=UPI00331B6931
MSYPPYDPPYYGPQVHNHPNGTTILVLGILSLVVCTFIGPFAWSMGNTALREIDESGYVFANRGQVQAGRVCGMVATALMALTLLFVAFGVTVAIVTS